MNFRPGDAARRLWDTWTPVKGEELHLFYLTNPAPAADGAWRPWDGIGHAVTRNLLDWEERETMLLRSPNPQDWDSGVILTGNTFVRGTGYGMTYAAVDRNVQKTGLLISDDLERWRRIAPTPVLVAGPPYESDLGETISDSVDFRDVSGYPQPDGSCEAIF